MFSKLLIKLKNFLRKFDDATGSGYPSLATCLGMGVMAGANCSGLTGVVCGMVKHIGTGVGWVKYVSRHGCLAFCCSFRTD